MVGMNHFPVISGHTNLNFRQILIQSLQMLNSPTQNNCDCNLCKAISKTDWMESQFENKLDRWISSLAAWVAGISITVTIGVIIVYLVLYPGV
jgi:hypothetical protein